MPEIKLPKSEWVKMTHTLRRTIVLNVLQKLYSKKIDVLNEEMQNIANGANRQMYPDYFKICDNPKLTAYVRKTSTPFYFRFDPESEPSILQGAVRNNFPTKEAKALERVPQLELRGRYEVSGPGTYYENGCYHSYHPTIPVPNKTFLNKITKILAERDDLIEEFNKFSQELFASVHQFTYVKELYDYLPELKELSGVSEYKYETPSYPVVISTATMMSVIQKFIKDKEANPVGDVDPEPEAA